MNSLFEGGSVYIRVRSGITSSENYHCARQAVDITYRNNKYDTGQTQSNTFYYYDVLSYGICTCESGFFHLTYYFASFMELPSSFPIKGRHVEVKIKIYAHI
jgi:hypothetical protein